MIDTAFYLKPQTDFDMRWAYYELLVQNINSMDSGSAIPSTAREDFYSLPVSFAPKKEQQAIAAILGALDDKIELNREMNRTLEEIAKALIRDFVNLEILRETTGGKRNRIFVFDEYLKLFTEE